MGFSGGFSTFSHFTEQTLMLAQIGELWLAFANVGASIILGLAAALLGEHLGDPPRPPRSAPHA
jgi:CrcB protein